MFSLAFVCKRLRSFTDGGGVRGLSALVLLEQLMELSNEHRRKLELPPLEPWQMFDMIGGTSTGGLIAIMLGRLRLSIPECKKAYMDLSEKAFTPKNFISRQIGVATVRSKFWAEPLEDAIKSLIGDDWESKLLRDDDPVCKVFVVSHLQDYTTHAVLRSYRNFRKPRATLDAMRIWQACRATSAALTFFDSIIIDGSTYSDGGLLYNNPVQLVHGEASEVFPNQEQLIISLGTGMGRPRVFDPHLFNVAQLLGDLASETERTADDFYRRDDGKAAKAGQYYRFNVPDIGEVGLEEVKKLKEIKDLTERYLEGAELGQKINSCAERLAGGAYKISESVTAKSEPLEGGVEDSGTQDLQRRLDALRSIPQGDL
ncbi:hypothetical protein FOVG_01433 [Fusarium oxysporum f. sp. pisi HDV247]|uniref:PNPLA domain-containing protein n=2 Tax=Fusarium oxysporum f. sp. pisi HDV247 TaxID=1080344 RepID=W9Q835_FUSOX|nr:hypothetical protein FOVG_01433 [Fusarium oxysporum f. sp. pisi HDV247]EXA53704.1 hypothetical protein FOVG_01433 [Fusarium oxysporum f. sp. pisi HDV247]